MLMLLLMYTAPVCVPHGDHSAAVAGAAGAAAVAVAAAVAGVQRCPLQQLQLLCR
jgi:hypothetical protein